MHVEWPEQLRMVKGLPMGETEKKRTTRTPVFAKLLSKRSELQWRAGGHPKYIMRRIARRKRAEEIHARP